jgi:hypothetical protein
VTGEPEIRIAPREDRVGLMQAMGDPEEVTVWGTFTEEGSATRD